MSAHESVFELLSLAAAGGLEPDEERQVRAHAAACTACAEELSELQQLTQGLRELPTPLPPTGLVENVRRRIHLELAGRADERLNQMLLVFLLFFSWSVTWVSYTVIRFFSGEPLMLWSAQSATGLQWSLAYFVVAWVAGAAAVILLGVHYRRPSRQRSPV